MSASLRHSVLVELDDPGVVLGDLDLVPVDPDNGMLQLLLPRTEATTAGECLE